MTAVVIALGTITVALAFVSIFQARENERLGRLVRDDLTLFIHYVYGVELGRAVAHRAARREGAAEDE